MNSLAGSWLLSHPGFGHFFVSWAKGSMGDFGACIIRYLTDRSVLSHLSLRHQPARLVLLQLRE